MIRKHLFKTVKTLTAATLIALGVMAGSNISTSVNTSGTVTAYAFEHQAYTDSTGYSLKLDGDTWHCYDSNGQIDYNYDGLALNDFGWWKVSNGTVDFSFTGLALNQYGWWYVNNGSLDFTYTGMAENEYGWWYVTNGAVDFSFNGMALNEYGWWYLSGGTVDFSYNGMAENNYGWWKITNGAVDFGFNGISSNKYGSWKLAGGTVDFGFTGSYEYAGKTYEVAGGYVVSNVDNNTSDNAGNNNNNADNSNTGNNTPEEAKTGKLELVDGQWLYMVDGKVDTSYNYMAENDYGWWKVTNGVVDVNFAGIAEKEDGTKWLFSGGEWNGYVPYSCQLNTEYIGTVIVDGVAYDTNRGYITPAKEDITKTYYLEPDEHSTYKDINMNRWSRGKYVKSKDDIIYQMDYERGGRYFFDVMGDYDKESNSFINTICWGHKTFFD